MGKRHFQNDSDAPVFIGGVMIPAGDGREVDEIYLQPEESRETETLVETDPHAALRELQKLSVGKIVPQLADLSDEDLAKLQEIEGEDGKSRTTLVAAITELQLQRAQSKAGGAPT